MSAGPTSRTLEYCRRRGWHADVVEKWIPKTRRRSDMFGGIDLVVMDGQQGLLGIQATSGSNVAARAHKLSALDTMAEWLAKGLRLEVWGWRRLAAYRKDGTRAKRDRWAVRIMRASLDDAGEIQWALVPGGDMSQAGEGRCVRKGGRPGASPVGGAEEGA